MKEIIDEKEIFNLVFSFSLLCTRTNILQISIERKKEEEEKTKRTVIL